MCPPQEEGLERLARILQALSHPLRLRIVALLAGHRELYLAEIAEKLGVSRALAKIHLKKLEQAGLVESVIRVEPGKAQARRYYRLVWRSRICISPEEIKELVEG
ncbi:MAG: helix-turn-helix transcriptional regulator [Crenarchaeota archaeon]|nr:helix-turn-helix transcriptional regulator [Thermoproteota archaeon]